MPKSIRQTTPSDWLELTDHVYILVEDVRDYLQQLEKAAAAQRPMVDPAQRQLILEEFPKVLGTIKGSYVTDVMVAHVTPAHRHDFGMVVNEYHSMTGKVRTLKSSADPRHAKIVLNDLGALRNRFLSVGPHGPGGGKPKGTGGGKRGGGAGPVGVPG
ncbi:MAG TPA: hypothetical protein VGH50_12460 [Candidatus Binatia bacterium]|jgi:hypothetical protein